jgi:hypothetical protein
LTVLSFLVVCLLLVQHGTQLPSGEALLKNVEAGTAGVRDYTVTLDITTDLEHIKTPPTQATMYFKRPDRIHFETQSFAMLPKDAFSLTPARLLQRFTPEMVLWDSLGGEPEYRLILRSRDERARSLGIWLYIHPSRWTIDMAQLWLPENRKLIVRLEHQKVENVWLPAVMTITFASRGTDKIETAPFEDQKPMVIRPMLVQEGRITIRYSGYRINTGLGDELFSPSRLGH